MIDPIAEHDRKMARLAHYDEIARAMGKSDGATKVLIHRAIKQLQERMEEQDDG